MEHQWDPDTDDVLLQAFRTLDPERNGYIEAGRMRELLMSKGTALREKEIEGFMNVAKDMETGHIYYEDYIALLTDDGAK